MWSDIRFRFFSGLEHWPAVSAADSKTSTSGDIEVSARRRKNGDSRRLRMSGRRIGRWSTNVIGVQWPGGLACNTKSKTGYSPQEKCPSEARRVKGVSQQVRIKHKKCRVLPSGKNVSDTLCMESDSCWTLSHARAHARSASSNNPCTANAISAARMAPSLYAAGLVLSRNRDIMELVRCSDDFTPFA